MLKCLRALLLVAMLTATASVHAQGSAAAAALFEEGRAAMKAEDWTTARDKLSQSDALDPQPGTKFSLAYCEEQLGRIATAWELYRAAAAAMKADDERKPHAEQRAEALAKRLPRLRVFPASEAPPGTTAKVGEVTLDARTFNTALTLDPGKMTIVVSAPGHEDKRYEVELVEGKTMDLSVMPGAATAPPPVPPPVTAPSPLPPPAKPERPDAPAEGDGTLATVGWILGGVGAVGLVVGTITGVMVLGEKSTNEDGCPPERGTCTQEGLDAASSGQTLGIVTTVSWVVGAAALATGIVLIVVGSEDETQASLTATPTGFSLRGSF